MTPAFQLDLQLVIRLNPQTESALEQLSTILETAQNPLLKLRVLATAAATANWSSTSKTAFRAEAEKR